MAAEPGYLYLIQLREFLNAGCPVYKLGRTSDLQRRLGQYPKGSQLIQCCYVRNMCLAETELLKAVAKHANLRMRSDYGREYVEAEDLPTLMHTFATISLKPTLRYLGHDPLVQLLSRGVKKRQSASRKATVDVDLSVLHFIQTRAATLTKATVPSLDLYYAFCMHGTDKTKLPLRQFVNIIKDHFGAVVKTMRFGDKGLCQTIQFGHLTARSKRQLNPQ